MEKHWVEQAFERSGAILRGHFRLTHGRHTRIYLNKRLIYTKGMLVKQISSKIVDYCLRSWKEISDEAIFDLVVGPEKGGIILAYQVAKDLDERSPSRVLSVFTEKNPKGVQVFMESGYGRLVAGKKVLVVDDILSTGGSVREVITAVLEAGGNAAAVAVICNRGGVTSEDVGGYPLFAVWETAIESWEPGPETCPLCRDGVPLTE